MLPVGGGGGLCSDIFIELRGVSARRGMEIIENAFVFCAGHEDTLSSNTMGSFMTERALHVPTHSAIPEEPVGSCSGQVRATEKWSSLTLGASPVTSVLLATHVVVYLLINPLCSDHTLQLLIRSSRTGPRSCFASTNSRFGSGFHHK
jgi:hypothetical protein